MSASGSPQRTFSLAHARFNALTAARLGAGAALGHAAIWLGAWLGRGTSREVNEPLAAAVLIAVFDGTAVCLYWALSRWLVAERGYRGADPYLRLCAGITLVDLVVRSAAMLWGTGGFAIASIPVIGPYGIMISYPHLQYFALGTALIALGYSLLRAADETGLLRAYALTAIVMGMAYAAFAGSLTIVPGVAGDLLLARLFLSPVSRPALRAPRRSSIRAPSQVDT